MQTQISQNWLAGLTIFRQPPTRGVWGAGAPQDTTGGSGARQPPREEAVQRAPIKPKGPYRTLLKGHNRALFESRESSEPLSPYRTRCNTNQNRMPRNSLERELYDWGYLLGEELFP